MASDRVQFSKPDRLSRLPVWDMLKRNYLAGTAAWDSGSVPSHMSSNAFVAQRYAEVIAGFLKDRPPGGQPVTILELGAGAGRLGFLIMRQLRRICAEEGLDPLCYRYVLSDISAATLDCWRRSGAFADEEALGRAAFALVDLDDPIAERPLAQVLGSKPGAGHSGMVVIGNYLLNSIRQDAFVARGGDLFEVSAALWASADAEPGGAEFMNSVEIVTVEAPAAVPYYNDRNLDAVLESYRGRFAEGYFTIPNVLLTFVREMTQAAGCPIVWLFGDLGYSTDAELVAEGPPVLAGEEGYCWLPINFDALRRYSVALGGDALISPSWDCYFSIAALMTGGRFDEHPSTRTAFRMAMHAPSPREISGILSALVKAGEAIPAERAVDALRLSNFDPRTFLGFRSAIQRLIADMNDRQERALNEALDHVAENHYPIGITRDVPYALGEAYDALGRTADARNMFRLSLRERGASGRTLYRLAAVAAIEGDMAEALGHIRGCLTLTPDFPNARKLADWISGQAGEEVSA